MQIDHRISRHPPVHVGCVFAAMVVLIQFELEGVRHDVGSRMVHARMFADCRVVFVSVITITKFK